MRGTGLVVVVAIGVAGCGGGLTRIVETRDLPQAGGVPAISTVVDLGGGDVPGSGQLRSGRSDGVAVIGEALWIRGKSFGRQPTVLVGGQPAAVLSRTEDGGILVRVPVRTPAGLQAVIVQQERGRAELTVPVRRFAAVLPPQAGKVAWLELGADGPVAAGSTDVPGARLLRLSADGRAAYVLGAGGALTVIEIPAPGGPRAVDQVTLAPGPAAVAMAAATTAHLVALVSEGEVVPLDTSSPLRPIRRPARALPPEVRAGRLRRVDLSADGRYLAVALAERNRVLLLEMARLGTGEAVAGSAEVLSEAPAPVVTDLAFAPDGRTLWVAAGNTAESRAFGPQPTRVFALRVVTAAGAGGRAGLELARTVTVEEVADPARLSTGRSLPLASGAAIRLPPEKATVFLAGGVRGGDRSAVFGIGAEDAATELVSAGARERIGGVDVTPEGRWLLAAALGGDGGLRVLTAPADGRPGPSRAIALLGAAALGGGGGGGAAAGAGAGPAASELRVQP